MATAPRSTVISAISHTLLDAQDDLILTGSDSIDGTGNDLGNQITGNVGENVLDGLKGADTLIGGQGGDSYIVDDVNDVVIEYADSPQTVVRVSTDRSDQEANGSSIGGVFSADGTQVLFDSNASNLVADDTNDVYDVFVKDIKTGEITRISPMRQVSKQMVTALAWFFPQMAAKSCLKVRPAIWLLMIIMAK